MTTNRLPRPSTNTVLDINGATKDFVNRLRSVFARHWSQRHREDCGEPAAQECRDFPAHFELRAASLGV
ncbi:hypothetical protein LO772_31755 [Yinghuangia sp. ASG 101]|uniref:hypothetical protein n=1 Tax=Yinghuangia sp. ASG 101 TaxID=2896848 RepID=UPI001E2FE8F5|nr:hypothetical protein [Yinghuangia sp. ASG 101]UGQ11322.1 hypothetical protein LO772_31755 [Yinghuangia sp. ASG 101]